MLLKMIHLYLKRIIIVVITSMRSWHSAAEEMLYFILPTYFLSL